MTWLPYRRALQIGLVRWIGLSAALMFLSGVTETATSVVPPIQVELLIGISARGTKVGKPIYARAVSDWHGPDCLVRTGGILKGRLVASEIHAKNSQRSSLALLFDSAECNGRQERPLRFTIAAVLAPAPGSTLNSSPPLTEAVGISIGGGGTNGRSVTTAAITARAQLSTEDGGATVVPGAVIGIRGLKLSVGAGPEGSSVVSTSGQDVRLERGSQLYLVVATVPLLRPSPLEKPAPLPPLPPTPPSILADESEVCAPPLCNVELPGNPGAPHPHAEASVSIGGLGYAPRPNYEAYTFDHEAALAYLGPEELLCTFNPHALVQRSTEEPDARAIRAALLDVATKKVKRTFDWRVTDKRRYLWTLGGLRALIHVGNELRIYGPGLKLEHQAALGGPLAFLTISPSGKLIVLGVEQERHTPETHHQLQSAIEGPPEEDVEVRLLDGDLQPRGSWLNSGKLPAPVLSDDGELRLVVGPNSNRYRIIEYGWDHEQRTIASVVSGCAPDLGSLPPNLILVSGCAGATKQRFRQVLKPDGKPVLRTILVSSELEHYAAGDSEGQVFALGILETARSLIRSAGFRAADLTAERIAIYRTLDGKRLSLIRAPAPSATEQAFALSPHGDQLAVLTGNAISFYVCRLTD